jgi:hypothetical protein
MFIQTMLARISRWVSNVLELQHNGGSWGEEKGKPRTRWHYFTDFGPTVAIIRDGKINTISGSFTVVAIYETEDLDNQKAPVISCKPLIMTIEKGDRLIFGRRNVDQEQSRLRHSLRYV